MTETAEFQGMHFLIPNVKQDYHTLEEAMHSILNYDGKLDLVIDIGAHVGAVSLVAAKKGAKKVIAYEADSRNYQCLCENIRINNFEKVITAHHLAVASRTGEKRRLCTGYESGGTSFYCDPANFKEEVGTIAFKDIIREHKEIDYLKIDVEGAEFEFIEPNEEVHELFKRVSFLDLETHPTWISENTQKDLLAKIKWDIGMHNEDLKNFIKSCGFLDYYGGYRKE